MSDITRIHAAALLLLISKELKHYSLDFGAEPCRHCSREHYIIFIADEPCYSRKDVIETLAAAKLHFN